MKPKNYVPGFARNGRRYASPLEERMAAVLEKERIPYEYGVFYRVNGGEKEREVDFVLKITVKPKHCDRMVKYVEVKSRMSPAAKKQHDELKEAGRDTFIVTGELIKFYEEEGFLDLEAENDR